MRCIMFLALSLAASAQAPRMPMPNDYANSIWTRWHAKPVLESRLIDGMEDLSSWTLRNLGQAKAEIALTAERSLQGKSSLRLRSRSTGDTPVPTERYFGIATVTRTVNNENWSDWNRLSIRIYPNLPGFRVVSLLLSLRNDGTEKVPDSYGKMGKNYVILRNHEWNHIVWEIANLFRDKVTGVELTYLLQGHEPAASDIVTFDFDQLELQKVKADHYKGWNVAPGEIAFSHSGYQIGAAKTAFSSDLDAGSFQLIDHATGSVILDKPVADLTSPIGKFRALEFSEVRRPGTYVLRSGSRTTRPFRIADDVWTSSIWKAINFFYTERCGVAIPGIHDACHRDWIVQHGDRRIIANGGWHDAGDLSQSFGNTAEAAYAMFKLAERMEARGEDPVLRRRLIDEAAWGLEWVLKTSFGDGFRPTFSTMDRWTNGILGDADDMIAQAGNDPMGNFLAAAVEALGARMLRGRDPVTARHSITLAEQDWSFALAGMSDTAAQRRRSMSELAGHGILAAVELWRTTGKPVYADKAAEMARIVLNSQQRAFLPGLDKPMAGWFYTGPDKERVLRYPHLSHEAAPVEALAQLCLAFPNHPDWIRWYTGVTLYSEYYMKPAAAFSAPYHMLASSIHKDDEHTKLPGGGRGMSPESYQRQVLNGMKLGPNHYLRLFPVWFEFRGNLGIMLTQNKAISTASHLRGSAAMSSLAQDQLHWTLGRNPFVQSLMWGEGYDYPPQYTAMSGDLVGALPVGVQTHADSDVPYWPAENCHNWKEVWVVPVSRWFWLMRDLAGPALIQGETAPGERTLELFTERTQIVRRIPVDPATGRFRAMIPEGEYSLRVPGHSQSLTALPGGTYHLDLRPGRALNFDLARQTAPDGTVTLTATVSGSGPHTLTVRADNVQFTEPDRRFDLKPDSPQTIVWKGKIVTPNAPWVAVVHADGNPSHRREATF